MILGAIADDLTGATDLASMLVQAGVRVVLTVGQPAADCAPANVDAVVIALKSRSIPASDAVGQSLLAERWLRSHGAKQIFFKYCSTFDSTDRGNIGPVLESLVRACGSSLSIACPAFPENGRTVYQGHLFIGSQLLNETGMRHHPLNPMTDANLVRVLQKQTSMPVKLIPLQTVRLNLAETIRELSASPQLAIVDAISNDDLRIIGSACVDHPVISGGSGLGIGLPQAYRERGWLSNNHVLPTMPIVTGYTAILAGSCSEATRRQIHHAKSRMPHWHYDIDHHVKEVLSWAEPNLANGPVLIESSAIPEELHQLESSTTIGAMMEERLAQIAVGLVEHGVRRLIIAGGETSGAIVARLGVSALRVGPSIAPGVPWTESFSSPLLALALKSGNFGDDDFFTKAWEMLP